MELWFVADALSERIVDRRGKVARIVATGEHERINGARFNLDATLLAVAREDGNGQLVDLRRPERSMPLPKSNRGIGWLPIAFSDDGRWLLHGQWLARLDRRIIELQKLEPVHAPGTESSFRCAAFTHDGRMLITGSGEWTQFWDLRSETPRPLNMHMNTDNVRTIAVNPDDQRVVTGSYDGSVRVFDLRDVTAPRPPLRSARHFVTSARFSADGQWLVTGSVDGRAYLWDVNADPRTIQPVPYGQSVFVSNVLLSRRGERLMAAYAQDGKHQSVIVFVRDLQELERIAARTVRRNFTLREWQQYFPAEPYQRTFAELPEN